MMKSKKWIETRLSANRFIRKYLKTTIHPLFDHENPNEPFEDYMSDPATFYEKELCWFMLNKDKKLCLHRDNGCADIIKKNDDSFVYAWYYQGHRIYEEEKYWNI